MDPERLMALLDADGDGQLSQTEMEEGRERLKSEMQARMQALRMQQR